MYIYTRDDSTAHRTPLRKWDIKSNQTKKRKSNKENSGIDIQRVSTRTFIIHSCQRSGRDESKSGETKEWEDKNEAK